MAKMEVFMRQLRNCLPSNEEEATTVLCRIYSHFQDELPKAERDLSLHILFQEEDGLSSFISQASKESVRKPFKMKKVVTDIFRLCSLLLEKHKDGMDPYVEHVKAICVSGAMRPSASAEEAEKALDALIILVRVGPWTADLNIPKLVTQIRQVIIEKPKKASTVLRAAYTLLGVLAELYPYVVDQQSHAILSLFLKELEFQTVSASKVEFNILEGCFSGLIGFLQSFSQSPSDDLVVCKKISGYIKRVIQCRSLKRNLAPRAALNLLAFHGAQFGQLLAEDYRSWHEDLSYWQTTDNRDDYIASRPALLTFYQEVAQYSLNMSNAKDITQYFLEHFKNQLQQKGDYGIAVKGFGFFAKSCKIYLPEEVMPMLHILAQRSDQSWEADKKHKLADYLESIAAVIVELDEVNSLQIATLEGITVQLVDQYSVEVNYKWQEVIVGSIVSTLLLLNRCSASALVSYLKTVVYQGILRSVSQVTVQDAELLKEAGQKVVTYQKYLPLWIHLLTFEAHCQGSYIRSVSVDEKKAITQEVLDQIITSALLIISKLDLALQEKDDSTSDSAIPHCDPEQALVAVQPLDFTLLVNLTSFLRDLFNGLPNLEHFRKWISPLIQYFVKHSARNYLISDFYKLLRSVLLVANKLNYFDEDEDEMQEQEWRLTVSLLSGHLQDAICRQSQFKGDLQVACLELLLATPLLIAKSLLPNITPAFLSVFRLGYNMLPLAREGLKTLQCWSQELNEDSMKPLLKAVLPSLDVLLQTKDNVSEVVETEQVTKDLKTVVAAAKKDKKIFQSKRNERANTELFQLQREVILFMSTLESDVCLSLLDGSVERMGITAWQKEKLLNLILPYQDMKPTVNLDRLLPRLVELALTCGDRQTRSSACEFLHSVVMLMIGTDRQLEDHRKGQLTCLWIHIFPALLRLGCDSDTMIDQLFKPLGAQLAHWYSSKRQLNSQQSDAFLEAVLNGIYDENSAALRDYSAHCLHEFVKWSQKQGNTFEKLKPLLKKICSLCRHPSSHKRLGAALAFNSIYTVLREDEKIVDVFWLELLHSFVTAMAICSAASDDTHVLNQAGKALQHIQRVLVQCCDVFNRENVQRRRPQDFTGTLLLHAVRWLLTQCTALNDKCRHACMKLVYTLSTKVSGFNSAKELLERIVKNEGREALLKIAEGQGGLNAFLPENAPWKRATHWAHCLIASLDCYIWLLQEIDIPSMQLLSLNGSNIFQAISHFVHNTTHALVYERPLYVPENNEKFNFAKCTGVVRIMDFLSAVLKTGATIPEVIWNEDMLQLVTYCTLNPYIVGFDPSSKMIEDNLPQVTTTLLQLLISRLDEESKNNLEQKLINQIVAQARAFNSSFTQEILEDRIDPKNKELIAGLKILQKLSVDVHAWSGFSHEKILDMIFDAIVQSSLGTNLNKPVTLTPGQLKVLKSFLKLAFMMSKEIKPLVSKIFNSTSLLHNEAQSRRTHGEHFLICFEPEIMTHMLTIPRQSVGAIFQEMDKTTSPQNLTVLTKLIDAADKSRKTSVIRELIEAIHSHWNQLCLWSTKTEDPMQRETWIISFLQQIAKSNTCSEFMFPPEIAQWIFSQISKSDRSLPFKTSLLSLFPSLTSHLENNADEIKKALLQLRDDHFPLQSSEFVRGSEQYIQFVKAIEELLNVMVISGSLTIFQIVMKMFAVDSKHICRDRLPEKLDSFMKTCKRRDNEVGCLNVVYDTFEDHFQNSSVRLDILNQFLLVMLSSSSTRGKETFAIKNIRKLLDLIGNKSALKDCSKDENKLVSRIGAWNIMQHIFNHPTTSFLEGKGSPLVAAAFQGTDTEIVNGKELVQFVTKRAMTVLRSPPEKEWGSLFKNLYRIFLCATYNMIATLISNLKTSPEDGKFYAIMLFKESPNKYLWRDLVDNTRYYKMSYEKSETMKYSKQLVTIRREARNARSVAGETESSQSLNFFASQSLFTGTLSSDITRFDFSHSKILPPSTHNNVDEVMDIDSFVLEMDSLNEHECMAMICGTIRHLVESKITPAPAEGSDKVILPLWMEELRKSLQDNSCPKNTCLFLLKVVLNCESYFAPYAAYWVDPVLDCLVRHCLNSNVSYFIADLVSLLVKWSPKITPSETKQSSVNKLVVFLIDNCHHSERQIFKFHVELIRSVIDVWKDIIELPMSLLLNMFEQTPAAAVNIGAIMLYHSIAPWSSETKIKYLNKLADLLLESSKQLYKASSEAVGLALKHLSDTNGGCLSDTDNLYCLGLVERLKNIHSKQRDSDRFLSVLYGIHESYPQIVDSLFPTILYYLVQMQGDMKAICLRLICARVEVLDSAFLELKQRDLLGMLTNWSVNVQVSAIQILVKLAPRLPAEDLLEIVAVLSANFQQFSKTEVRQSMYELVGFSYDQYALRREFSTLDETERTLLEESKTLLLFGLVDKDVTLQSKCFKLWTEDDRLPNRAADRLLSLFSTLYSVGTEEHFLGYSVPLMLEGTSSTPDYESFVFLHPLSDCTYESYPLLASWRAQHAQITPMFAQTFSSQVSKLDSFNESMNDSSLRLLATQNTLLFDPTQQDTEMRPATATEEGTFIKSSLLFTIGSQDTTDGKMRNYKQGPGFGTQRLKPSSSSDTVDGESHSSFKSRRFLGKNAASMRMAMSNVRRNKLQKEMKQERERKREGQISVFRKYRIGDLPDIQLKTSDFIKPLKDLVRRDCVIARHVLVGLFAGVQTQLESLNDIPRKNKFCEDVCELMTKILTSSKRHEPALMGTVLEIGLEYAMDFDAALVTSSARNSGLLPVGALLLEDQIPLFGNDPDSEESTWLQLAELYGALGESDVVRAIFQHKVNLSSNAINALTLDSAGDWKQAKMLYFEALKETQVDNFYEAYFECLSRMSEWKDVSKSVRGLVEGNVDSLWEEQWQEEKLLPRLIQSDMMEILAHGRDQNKFVDSLNKWLVDEEKSTRVKERFSEQISVLHLFQNKLPKARFFAAHSVSMFLNDWVGLSPLSEKLRAFKLLNVQKIAELLMCFIELEDDNSQDHLNSILQRFSKSHPQGSDPLAVWEARTFYRSTLLRQIDPDSCSSTANLNSEMFLDIIETALKQNNSYFAKKYLEFIRLDVEARESVMRARWLIARCEERLLWATRTNSTGERLSNLLTIWDRLDKIIATKDLDEEPALSVSAHGVENRLTSQVRILIKNNPQAWRTLKTKDKDQSKRLVGRLPNRNAISDQSDQTQDICDGLEQLGLMSLRHSLNVAKNYSLKNKNSESYVAEAYYKVTQYCRSILEDYAQSSESSVSHDSTNYTRELMNALLKAMRYGSSAARQLFPVLLQLPNLATELKGDFIKAANNVPEWMFLDWIPQLLAFLDTPTSDTIAPLLIKISEMYPNAVSYPYNLSRDNINRVETPSYVVQKLDEILERSEANVRFIRALSCLCYPHIILQYHVGKLERQIKSNSIDWMEMGNVCSTILTEALPQSKEMIAANYSLHGNFFKATMPIRKSVEKLVDILKRQSLSGVKNAIIELSKLIAETFKGFEYEKGRGNSTRFRSFAKLADFSPWLADFVSSNCNTEIEIPGQYSGKQRPTPDRHILISQFGEDVQIMPSLRKPIKLTIIGTDTLNYDFLVKFGEDLRQDERVQQLLGLINGLFLEDQNCRQRRFSVFLYKVIPMSSRLGMIQWVDNTTSLKELMASGSPNAKELSERAAAEHYSWIGNYLEAYVKYNRQESIQAHSKLVDSIPKDILRRGLQQLSSSPEAFFTMRHRFITSYSAMCVAHWLLGIGDRHQSNCLVSQSDGQCIGIDFGHAFGTATQFLPFPELIPFRLTPHILGIMEPFGYHGLIEESMVHCVQALRNHPDILLATMQVFILEPSLDWLLWSQKHAQRNSPETKFNLLTDTWLPEHKVRQARLKLDGVNPVRIFEDDLNSGHGQDKKVLQAFLSTVRGDADHNDRAKLPKDGLNPRQQVNCLLDLATDYNILSKTWKGWEPWM